MAATTRCCCARDLGVPFTNIRAERDIRPTKTQLKISGCHRSEATAKAWLRIQAYISIVVLHSDNIYDAPRRHHRQPLDTTRDLLT